MKAIIFFILFTLLAIPTAFAQIKIGDNPQNIDASSVLELESTSKVLVITRVTTLEMEAITPQRGGMVYNTDTECINYFDGTQWVNLCDAVNFSITNDPIINGRSTIEITETAGSINLEVAKNSILGDNIIDGGIGPDDIQDNSITQEKLAAESVGSSELRQNSVGSEEIRDASIAPADIANFTPGQVLTTDENGIVQWEDSDGLFDLTFNKLDTTLTIARSTIAGVSTISLGALIGSDDQQLDLTDNILSIENGENTLDLSTYLQELSINAATNEITLSNGNTITLPAAAAEVDGIVGNEILNAYDGTLVRFGGGTDTNPYTLDVNAGGIDTEELANNAVTNIKLADNSVRTANIVNGTISTLDIAPSAAAPANAQILSTSTAGVVGWIDIPAGTVDTDEQQLSIVGNRISLTDGGFVDIPEGNLSLDDGFIFVGNAASEPTPVAVGGDVTMNNIGEFAIEDEAVTTIKIEPAPGVLTEDQVLITTIAGDVEWADFPPGGGGADGNTTNASLTEDGTNLILTDSEGDFITIPLADLNDGADDDTTNASLTEDGTNLILTDSEGNFITIPLADINNGADNDTTNATLTEDGTNLILTDSEGDFITIPLADINSGADNDTTNATLTEDGTNLILTDSEGDFITIPLADIDSDTTNSTLTEDGTNLILTDSEGTTVEIALADIDSDTTNATLTEDGTNLILTDSEGDFITIPLADISTGTTNATLTEDGTNLILTDSEGDFITISLADIDSDTTNATLTEDGTNFILTDSEGDFITIPLADIDSDTTNATLTEDGTNLILTDSEGDFITIPLADISTGTTNTNLTEDGTNLILTDSEGDFITIPLADIDSDTTNATLTEDGTNLILTDSEGDFITIPLADISTGTTNATLTEDGINLILTDSEGDFITIPLADIDTRYTAGAGLELSVTNVFSIASNSIQGSFNGGGATSMIIPNTIGQADIADGAVGASEIQSNAVSSDEIDDGSIVNIDIALGAAIEGSKINPNFGAQNITTTGDVNAEDVIISGSIFRGLNDLHPDYVFQKYFLGNSILNPNYKFNDLAEIEAFVKENNHLPGIKSAAAIKEQGFWDLGEASRINLEKIEELFLHTIEQEKKIKELQSANTNMSTELEALKAQMTEIKTMLLEKQNN